MRTGNRKKGARAAGRRRLRILLAAVLAFQLAVSPAMAGMVTYAMEDTGAGDWTAAPVGDNGNEDVTESKAESGEAAEGGDSEDTGNEGVTESEAESGETTEGGDSGEDTESEGVTESKAESGEAAEGGDSEEDTGNEGVTESKAESGETTEGGDSEEDTESEGVTESETEPGETTEGGDSEEDTGSEGVTESETESGETTEGGQESGAESGNATGNEKTAEESLPMEGRKLLYAKEAEDAQLLNEARVTESEEASGGRMVGYIGTDGGSHADGMVVFTVAGVKAGSYELQVYYAVDKGDDRYFDIHVNGQVAETGNKLPGTGSFGTPSETPHSLSVELKDGVNTIGFGCEGWYAPNLDRIEIYGAEDIVWDEPGQKLLYAREAEDAQLTNGAGTKDAEKASGGRLVNGIGANGSGREEENGTVTFKVSGVKAGSYGLWVYYAADATDRYFDIQVNGETLERTSFPTTGSFDIPCETPVKADISLKEGENTVSFSCLNWYAPDLDRIEIYGAEDIVWDEPESEAPVLPAEPDLVYQEEAENAVLTNGASPVKAPKAYGGQVVEHVGTDGGGHEDGTVTFTVPDVKAGLYELRIYYAANATDRYFDIHVNGEKVKGAAFPTTGSFLVPCETPASMNIELKDGENTISFGCEGWYAPNLDCIQIYPAKETDVAADTRLTLQAEEARLLGSASKDYDSSSCANGGKVNNIGGDGNGAVVFEGIELSEPGTYAIDVAYAAKENRNFLITVQGMSQGRESGKEIWINCPAGYEWDVPNRHIVTCEMEAGTYSIQIGNPEGYAPNLDEIRIYRCRAYDMGKYTFLYDMETGRYNLIADGRTRLNDAFAAVSADGELYRSVEYASHEITEEAVEDSFGRGTVLHTISRTEGSPVLKQDFYLYEGQAYFLTQMEASWEDGQEIGSNYIAPLYINSIGGVENEMDGKDYFLRVPYDNDGWVKYELSALSGSNTGYEAAAILNEGNGKALVMGSLSHDTWKTGISYTGSRNQLYELRLYGGANGELTRDQSPHGTVTGSRVNSPLMFVGYYGDWQNGMDAYAEANTLVEAPKMDAGNVPFGWNSWGSVQSDINLAIANGISDYIHDNLQDAWMTDEGDVVYTVLDSYWDMLDDDELAEFVKHCKENGQEAGIYWAPFVSWHGASSLETAYVEGTQGTEYEGTLYKDIILKKADGNLYGTLDGAFPVDMTHPAAQLRVNYFIDRFKKAGFTYIKLDFLVHGALEGEHFDKSIAQTGTQAYNFGMKYVTERLGGQMFINLSIAPTFPYQYADGKRIACDAYYSIGNTEYTLNGLTYGFWQKKLYQYPDPDHLVIWGRDGKASLEEARSRATSGILLGTSFLTGDNFVDPAGDREAADERFRGILTNPDIIAAAKTGKIFRPVEISHNRDTSNMFVMTDGGVSYLAVLNYNLNAEYVNEVDLKSLFGLDGTEAVKELWSGEEQALQDGVLHIALGARDAKVYRIGTVKEPEPTDTPAPTGTPEPTGMPEPTGTPGPTGTPEPGTPEPTETPAPTGMPKPEESTKPTGTPKPEESAKPDDDSRPGGDNQSGGNGGGQGNLSDENAAAGGGVNTTSPKTGDNINLFIWLTVMSILAIFCISAYYNYREKTEE